MGLYRSNYLSCYVKLGSLNKAVKVKEEIYSCPNNSCDKHKKSFDKDSNFCDSCGEELKYIKVLKEKKLDWYEVFDELGIEEDYIMPTSYIFDDEIFFGTINSNNFSHDSGIIGDDEGSFLIDIDQNMAEIGEVYTDALKDEEEIKNLEKFCEDNDIEFKIGFGLISDLS